MTQSAAIVGIGCRFPGGANSPEAFWQLLRDGVEAIGEVPPDRYDVDSVFDPDPARKGTMYTRRGGFVDDIDRFDAAFFGFSPREASRVDPQHRLLLEIAYEALEDAGLSADQAAGSRTGVFVGFSAHDYSSIQMYPFNRHLIDSHSMTGGASSIAANRISYMLDLRGPSFIVDTACSSALTAVHLAMRSLRNGECDLALAGGAQLNLTPEISIGFCKASMISPDGRCHAFDARANGYVRGEGGGLVLLKPLDAALADGDRIYAVLVGTGVNQDGGIGGMTVPSAVAQEEMLRAGLADAGLEPAAVQYAEAHGTGTPVGDPIEAAALGAVFGSERRAVPDRLGQDEHRAPRGGRRRRRADQVRTGPAPRRDPAQPELRGAEPGHRLRRARATGRHRAGALAVQRRGPHRNDQLLRLRRRQRERRAAGGASRRGGRRHHAGAGRPVPPADLGPQPRGAGRARRALRRAPARAQTRTPTSRSVEPRHAVAHITTSGSRLSRKPPRRPPRPSVRSSPASGRRQSATGRRKAAGPPSLAFVFSGMGPQWWAMGRQLAAEEPVFAKALERCDEIFEPLSGWSLRAELQRDEADSRMDKADVAQVTNVAVQIALADLWASWGITPDAVVGHSVGEIAAAHVAGALTLEDTMLLAYHRSRLQAQTAGQGKMLAAGIPEAEAETLLGDLDGTVSLAAVNAPSSVTLSGDPDALEQLRASLEAEGRFARLLPVDVPYHSPKMDPLEEELLASLEPMRPRDAEVPFVSIVTGTWHAGTDLGAAYWWQNVRRPVRFGAAIECLADEGISTYLEVGPHPVLSISVNECLRERESEGTVLPSLRRGENEREFMLRSLGALFAEGREPDWETLYPGTVAHVPLPAYPWQRERHWFESSNGDGALTAADPDEHPLLGRRLRTPEARWEVSFGDHRLAYLHDHVIQGTRPVPAAAFVEMGLAASRRLLGHAAPAVQNVEFKRALFLGSEPQAVQIGADQSSRRFDVQSPPPDPDSPWTLLAGGSLAGGAAREESVDLPDAPGPLPALARASRSVRAARRARLRLRACLPGARVGGSG